MNPALELGIVIVVVGGAAFWAGRAIWRSVSGRDKCSSCASSGGCPLVENPDLIAELGRKGQLTQLTNMDSCQPGAAGCDEVLKELGPAKKK